MIDGKILRYASGERDSIIASLLDGARASGNKGVCVRMNAADRCLRWAPMQVQNGSVRISLPLMALS